MKVDRSKGFSWRPEGEDCKSFMIKSGVFCEVPHLSFVPSPFPLSKPRFKSQAFRSTGRSRRLARSFCTLRVLSSKSRRLCCIFLFRSRTPRSFFIFQPIFSPTHLLTRRTSLCFRFPLDYRSHRTPARSWLAWFPNPWFSDRWVLVFI